MLDIYGFNRLFFNRLCKILLFAGLIALASPPELISASEDLPGSQDHPLIGRLKGSVVVGYNVKDFDEYTLQTSTFKKYDLETKQREYVKAPLKLEGKVTRIWYEAAGKTSSLELAANYRNELTAKGFKILYDSRKDSAAKKWTNFLADYNTLNIETSRSYYVFFAADNNNINVLSAQKKQPDGDIFIFLTTVEWSKDDPVYKSKQGAYGALDIIKIRPMKQNMVVTAAEMSETMTATGRVALYGIFFDTNRSEVKPESKPTIEEIAKLLKQNSNQNLYVVGHTDNVGEYEHNLKLSQRRAEAVKKTLTAQYGILPERLKPHGVANLAPTATNINSEGRAKNRRVELVPY